jgi:hypothetical protein
MIRLYGVEVKPFILPLLLNRIIFTLEYARKMFNVYELHYHPNNIGHNPQVPTNTITLPLDLKKEIYRAREDITIKDGYKGHGGMGEIEDGISKPIQIDATEEKNEEERGDYDQNVILTIVDYDQKSILTIVDYDQKVILTIVSQYFLLL